MTYRKKLIEVALPLEAINVASSKEKANPFIREHPRTLHLWWARRPLVACRAVIFASLVDDPDDPDAPAEFVEACRNLPRGANAADNDTPRMRLFDFIERLVLWESTTDEEVLETARHLIRLATDGNPPPLLDPFAGGGSIPLEAQRLGLEAHASDLNPVAVMICKALIEIPPRFANMQPVNPDMAQAKAAARNNRLSGSEAATTSRLSASQAATTNHLGGSQAAKAATTNRLSGSTNLGLGGEWKGAAGLAADVRYYGQWMRNRAWERIGHLYPKYYPSPSGRGDGGICVNLTG